MSTHPKTGAARKLTVTQLVQQISASTSLTHKQSRAVVTAMCGLIVQHLQAGVNVGLPRLGLFRVMDTAERQARKPTTTETVTLAAGRKVRFRTAPTLRDQL